MNTVLDRQIVQMFSQSVSLDFPFLPSFVLGFELRVLYMFGKYSSTDLYPQHHFKNNIFIRTEAFLLIKPRFLFFSFIDFAFEVVAKIS